MTINPVYIDSYFKEHLFPLRIATLYERYKRSTRDGTDATRFADVYPVGKETEYVFTDIYYEVTYNLTRNNDNFTVKINQRDFLEKHIGWGPFRKLKKILLGTFSCIHTFTSDEIQEDTKLTILSILDNFENYQKEYRSLNQFLTTREQYEH